MTDDKLGARRLHAARSRKVRGVIVLAAALSLVTSCSDNGTARPTDTPAKSATTTTEAVSSGLVTDVAVAASPKMAHVPIVTVTTSGPATVTVTATSGDHEVVTPATKVGTTHEVPVLGLRTDRKYTLSVEATDDAGAVDDSADTVSYTTPPLPKDFPPIEVSSDPDKVEAGFVLMNLKRVPTNEERAAEAADPDAPTLETGRVIGVDAEGEVVWYYETPLQVLAVEPTSRGTFLLGLDDQDIDNLDNVMREIDVLGNTVREWDSRIAQRTGQDLGSEGPVPTEVDSIHHDVHELPNGNLMVMSTKLIPVDEATGRALCPDDPVPYLVSDVVVEYVPDTGKAVQEWPVDVGLDPVKRPGTGMCGAGAVHSAAPDAWMYPDASDERDWTHANAIAIDEAHNTLIVSLRNLSAVVGLRYHDDASGAAGEKLWELGTDGDLVMQGDGHFPYEQHAVELRDDGTLILYDNGHPEGVDGKPPTSRAVIYRIDPEAHTVEQLWEHSDENSWGGPTFSQVMSDADQLDNGNVLITHGIVLDDEHHIHVRITEVTPDLPGGGADDEVVFDFQTGSNVGEGWVAYHAVKVRTLFPPS